MYVSESRGSTPAGTAVPTARGLFPGRSSVVARHGARPGRGQPDHGRLLGDGHGGAAALPGDGLGLSPLGFGLLDGVYNGFSALVRLVGGHLADRGADRGGRHKPVAAFGYGLSALCKPLLLHGAHAAADRRGAGAGPYRQGPAHRPARRADLAVVLARDARQGLRRAPGDGHHGRAARAAGRLPDPAVRRPRATTRCSRSASARPCSACWCCCSSCPPGSPRRRRRRTALPEPAGGPASAERPSLRAALRPARPPRAARPDAVRGGARPGHRQRLLHLSDAAAPTGRARPLVRAAAAGHGGAPSCCSPCRWAGGRTGSAAGGCSSAATSRCCWRTGCCSRTCGPALPYAVLALHGTFYAATDGVLMAAAAGSVPAALRSSGLALVQTGQAGARFFCLARLRRGLDGVGRPLGPERGAAVALCASVSSAAALVRPVRPYRR